MKTTIMLVFSMMAFCFAALSAAEDTLITVGEGEISVEQVSSSPHQSQSKPISAEESPQPESTPLQNMESDFSWIELPQQNNGFIIDKTIRQLKIILSKSDAADFALTSPTGGIITAYDDKPDAIWDRSEQQYVLVVDKPLPGQWTYTGTFESTPEVLVNSSLQLEIESLAKNALMGEAFALEASLTFKKKLVQNELLKYTQFFVIVHHPATKKKYKIFLKDNGQGNDKVKDDGIFTHQYRLHYLPGLYEITYHAVGLSFKRSVTQQVFVHDYPGQVRAKYDLDRRIIEVDVKLKSPFIQTKDAKLLALFYAQDGNQQVFEMQKIAEDQWVTEALSPGKHDFDRVLIDVAMTSNTGKPMNVVFAPIKIAKLYDEALAKEKVKKRMAIMASDDFQLGHILSVSREKTAQDLALLSHQTHYSSVLPVPQNYYQTMSQRMMSWWLLGENAPAVFGVGMKNQGDITEPFEDDLVQPTDAKNTKQDITAQNEQSKPEPKAIGDVATPQEVVSGPSTLLVVFVVFLLLISMAGMGIATWILLGKRVLPLPEFIKKRLISSQEPLQNEQNHSEDQAQQQVDPSLAKKPKAPKAAKKKVDPSTVDLDDDMDLADREDIDDLELEEEPHEVAENLKSAPKAPSAPQKGVGVPMESNASCAYGPMPGCHTNPVNDNTKNNSPVVEESPTIHINEEEKRALLNELKNRGLDEEPKEGAIAATSSLFFYEEDDDEEDDDEEDEKKQLDATEDALKEELEASEKTDSVSSETIVVDKDLLDVDAKPDPQNETPVADDAQNMATQPPPLSSKDDAGDSKSA